MSSVNAREEDSTRMTGTMAVELVKSMPVPMPVPDDKDNNDDIPNVVSLQLIGSVTGNTANERKGFVGKAAYVKLIKDPSKVEKDEKDCNVTFEIGDEDIGIPGGFLVKNTYKFKFYLKTLTLTLPGQDKDKLYFICNSWVYPSYCYKSDPSIRCTDRIFFSNKTYLPADTPTSLKWYREEELATMRGSGTGVLQEWHRVYDYDVYNDLGNPDKGEKYARTILGESTDYPYPRRGRTGRARTNTDPKSERRLSVLHSLNIYVPRDERFGHVKMSDFLDSAFKSFGQVLIPALETVFDPTENEFDSFQDILDLYKPPTDSLILLAIKAKMPKDMQDKMVPGQSLLNFPTPQVLQNDQIKKDAWRSDEEFGREMLAGVNPVCITLLREFPPRSKLDPNVYGNQHSSITKQHVECNLGGLSIEKAIEDKRMFMLDHHDTIMPYLRKVNTTSTKTYATRTILFLQDDGTLKPVAIELSLPHEVGDEYGAVNKVYTPGGKGVAESMWQLAKAYVAVNDSGVHQLISHWLNTHAVIEPFIIAMNRQLSVMHPIHKLLHPHFRNTMNINALARQILINAGGVVESTVFPGKYALEMSAVIYKDWVFTEQALPADLIKRGVAVEDSESGVRLLIQDYPYAVDGLEIWSAIKTWVHDYCSFYYKTDEVVRDDSELQAWWKDVVEKGHGDKKDAEWWPKMQTIKELVESCTTIIWVASALHAAVNFGQYSYGGYIPCRPTMSRRFMPKPGTVEYEELEKTPDKAFLKTITPQLQTLLGVSIIEILSSHSTDEVYLGERLDSEKWTADQTPLNAFKDFGEKLTKIEEKITERNNEEKWKNRSGPVKVPYTLLFRGSDKGLTGKGIPNSVSI